jgi:quercetin dioxygenase-like cupin family protein
MPTRDDCIAVGPLTIRFLVEAPESNGTVSVFTCTVPAGARVPAPHSHDGFEETIYGLSGRSTWTIAGRTVEIDAGSAVCIPRGAVHAFDNRGETDTTFLAIATPGVFGREYFTELGALVASSAGPPDPAAIGEVMRRHGLTPVATPRPR